MKDPLQTHIMKNHFFVEAPIGALLYPELSIQQIFLPKLELPKAKLYISHKYDYVLLTYNQAKKKPGVT